MVPLFFLPLGAWLVGSNTLVLSTCGFKVAFGLPCVSCGSTRATLHLFDGDFWTALTFQPMTMLIYTLLTGWGLLSLWALLTRRSVSIDLSKREDMTVKLSLVFVPLINWSYLVWAGI